MAICQLAWIKRLLCYSTMIHVGAKWKFQLLPKRERSGIRSSEMVPMSLINMWKLLTMRCVFWYWAVSVMQSQALWDSHYCLNCWKTCLDQHFPRNYSQTEQKQQKCLHRCPNFPTAAAAVADLSYWIVLETVFDHQTNRWAVCNVLYVQSYKYK